MDITAHVHAGETSPRPTPPAAQGGEFGLPAALLQRAFEPGELSEAAACALSGVATERRVRAGDAVLSRDAAAEALWLVVQGSVALGRSCTAGFHQRHSVSAGEWLDLGSALLGGRHLEDAQAQTDAVLWQLPLADLRRCAAHHRSVMSALAAALASQVSSLVERTRGLMTKDVRGRCATWLLSHAERAQADHRIVSRFNLQQRKRAVAQQIGTTAETFSRTLRQLSQDGLIAVEGYAITLLDVDALRRLAEPAAADASQFAS